MQRLEQGAPQGGARVVDRLIPARPVRYHRRWGSGLLARAMLGLVLLIGSVSANAWLQKGIEYHHPTGTPRFSTKEGLCAWYTSQYPDVISFGADGDYCWGDTAAGAGYYWFYLWKSTTPACPPNSTQVGESCTCRPGFAEDVPSNSCIPAAPEPVEGSCRASGVDVGHPIVPASEAKVRSETDWSGQGPAALSFVREYQSTWAKDPGRPQGPLGTAWSHNHLASLTITATPTGKSVSISTGDGRLRTFFQATGASDWTGTSNDSLSQPSQGTWIYRRSDDDAVLQFSSASASGRLLSITARNGWVTTYTYHASGRLASVSNGFGQTLSLAYDSAGRLTSVTVPGPQVIGYAYDASGRLSSVTAPDGQSRAFLYENGDYPQALTGIVDESGARWGTFGYDGAGRATSTELAGGVERYQVSYPAGDGSAATVTDPLGTVRTFHYGLNQGKLAVTGADTPDGTGRPDAASRVQNALGLIESETDFLGTVTTYQWDTGRRLPLGTTQAAGTPEARTTTTEWHPQWHLPVKVTEAGRETAYSYDGVGNLLTRVVTDTSVSPARTRTWGWTYHPSGLVATATEPSGAVTTFGYDAQGHLTQATNALGQSDTYTHDAAGRVLTHTAATGLVSRYAYDPRGRLTRLERGEEVSLYTYRPTGQLATASTPEGYQITYQYDAAQRPTGWSDNRGASASYTLDGLGNPVGETIADAQGQAAWQLARSINGLNRVERVTLGGAGSGSSSSVTTGFGYDANGEQVRSTETVDGASRSTTLALDALRRVKTITNAQNASATLAYDARDAVVQATDFQGVATGYVRDALGNALQESTPDGGPLTTTYDALGLPQAITDALGRASSITRDALGRPTQIVSSASGGTGTSRTTLLRYDLSGSDYNAEGAPQASAGQLSEIQDPEVTTRYQRDLQGRITRKTEILANGDSRTLGYRYGAAGSAGAGQIAAITYPSGRQLQYQYDATGQLTGLQWNGQPLVAGLTWSPLGQPTAWQWSGLNPGQSEQRSYTTAGQLAASRLLPELVWDGAGRVTRIQQRHALPGADSSTHTAQQATLTSVFTYDTVGRLTASAHSAPADLTLPLGWGLGDTLGATASGYAWDANGNRTQVHHTSATGAGNDTLERVYARVAGSNRLQGYAETFTSAGTTASSTQVNYSQDATGALTKKGDTYLHYGVDGRIAKVGASNDPANALAVSYTTNALGQRVFKRDARLSGADNPATTQQTVYAEDGIGSTVLGQYGNRRSGDSAAPPGEMDSTEVIWLPTASGPMPVAAQINGRLYAIDADHLNTPRRLTNAQGQVVWQWLITGFGEANPTTGATGYAQSGEAGVRSYGEAVRFDLRYPGQVWDGETGLSYNLHRYYDAGMGRYIQADPIGLEGGWNRFGYVGGNPLSFIDPEGLQFLDLTTLAGARRNTTLDEAVRAGAWTRAVTMPAVTAGLTPSAIGLVGSASAPLFCAAPETVTVSRWGREGLEAGDWVMKGGVNRWNYVRSFKWERTPWNQPAPYSTGASYQVPNSSLVNPGGWETFKIIFGQRIYRP
ncbi:RHS repeat-associated protein [Paracidovorax anthurii]|uniref:RHS repeat-associated protein n=1 Tax=Paracidovorax anthurii TaxID=78229 RepID=A0A328ZBQ8_9BURK|nr:RHS repeat-associated core domain-containing protein [Paracidovorax anthurii]RAR79726.1 RHS repeat-associated protein [Paracidovorax anthurii]